MKRSATELPRVNALKLLRRGKVRDVYDRGQNLLLVASDRLSAFDHVLPTPIPDKGKILTQVSLFWFNKTKDLVPNHFISADWTEIRKALGSDYPEDFKATGPASWEEFLATGPYLWKDRSMLVVKTRRIDVECVVRGYLAGSAYKEYKQTATVCGIRLPKRLREAERLPEPIFTPAAKADEGHDENISWERCVELTGEQTARELKRRSLQLYGEASRYLEGKGLILADTKFEFGEVGGKIIAIDEMLTPDSSRVWDADGYKPGSSPASFDKQYVRDYLERVGWNKRPPAPELPAEVVQGTARRYREFLRRTTA